MCSQIILYSELVGRRSEGHMKALVTGGAGFIGSHLVDLLINRGFEVVVVDNFSTGSEEKLEEALKSNRLRIIRADTRSFEEIKDAFSGIDIVYHLAAVADVLPSIENPRYYYEVNVNGSFNVLEAAKQAKVKKLIYAASCSCYGICGSTPVSEDAAIDTQYPYALTKYLGELLTLHYHKVYQLPILSLRLFNVFGPRSRKEGLYGAVIPIFLTQKLHERPMTIVGNGKQTRDFVYVTDVAEAFYLASKTSISGEIFNIGSGKDHSVLEIAEMLKGPLEFLDKRPGETERICADIRKAQKHLGYQPKVSFEKGIAMVLEKIDEFKDSAPWDKTKITEATKTWVKYLGPDKF